MQKLPGLVCRGHHFDVPLDYANPSGAHISVFAREIRSVENANRDDLPLLLFLQGGPGFQSPRPEGCDGWLKRALKDFRVLLLDQRGTGLSTPVTYQTMAAFSDSKSQFEYLKHFRADNIVRDSEFIRNSLGGGKPWTLLGQSYGGFCATTYLSHAPEGVAGVMITGGLPPLLDGPDEVYRATYKQVIGKNKLFYSRFPDDRELVASVIEHLNNNRVLLPTGEVLSARRFLQLGIAFGFNSAGGSMNTVHYLLESAFVKSSGEAKLSHAFLSGVERMSSFNQSPIYSLLHEPLYCQKRASNWSADRTIKEFPEFNSESHPVYFTGEMIYSWMFEEYEQLKPLRDVAMRLAEYDGWPELYDVERLLENSVPCVAAVYYNDMYVDKGFSEQTAGIIKGSKFWITNEYEHDGIRQNGEYVVDRLLAMLRDACP